MCATQDCVILWCKLTPDNAPTPPFFDDILGVNVLGLVNVKCVVHWFGEEEVHIKLCISSISFKVDFYKLSG